MIDYKKHLIRTNSSLKVALTQLSKLGTDAILFVIDAEEKLLGSITDGDVRRGLLKGFDLKMAISRIMNENMDLHEKLQLLEENKGDE